MQVKFNINQAIIRLTFSPSTSVNIRAIEEHYSSYFTYYRGTVCHKNSEFTVKISRNAFINFYFKRNLALNLSHLQQIALNLYFDISPFMSKVPEDLFLDLKNIHITFSLFQVTEDFSKFCFNLYSAYQNLYTYEIRESFDSECPWLKYSPNAKRYGSFRLRKRGTLFTINFSFKGNCITGDINEFFDFTKLIENEFSRNSYSCFDN